MRSKRGFRTRNGNPSVPKTKEGSKAPFYGKLTTHDRTGTRNGCGAPRDRCALSRPLGPSPTQSPASRHQAYLAAVTAFLVLFWIVGVSLWGLPFYYDFMVQQFGWTRAQVTSGNALSKLVVGPRFGFLAGWVVDHFGPRRLMMVGILMAGAALVGLGWISSLGMFYFFYLLNALGYVCGGPLPNQALLTQWFDRSRGTAMGFAYLGIGIGGATVPWMSHTLVQHFGWQTALRILGLLIVVVSFPLAPLVKEPPTPRATVGSVEYIVDAAKWLKNNNNTPPALEGQDFEFVAAPNVFTWPISPNCTSGHGTTILRVSSWNGRIE
jgi:MFS family permease